MKTVLDNKLSTGEMLPLWNPHSSGRGYHSGLSSYFIRLGGCDIGCHWCDVESWDFQYH